MTKTKEQIITKIVRDLPNSNALSEMNGSEWYGWFEECWNEAINYTHCCTGLKEKKAIPFEDWARVKGIKLLIDSNYRWGETYVYKEVVMKMYEVYLINL